MKSVMLAVALLAFTGGFLVGAGTAVVTADAPELIGADICCPQGSIPGCYCFPNRAVPAPCPNGYGPIYGTDMCGVILGANDG